jgi:predicted chitinase
VQNTAGNGAYRLVTEEQVRTIMRGQIGGNKNKEAELEKNLSDYTKRLNDTMQQFGINTPLKQAMFLATISQESIGMTSLVEDPSKFKSSQRPDKGRGIIQLTGDQNYRKASEAFNWGEFTVQKDKNGKQHNVFTSWVLIDDRNLASKPDYAFPIAGWFWSVNGCNNKISDTPRADLQDFRLVSGIVNSGGTGNGAINGWGDRLARYKEALTALNIGMSDELRQNLDLAIKQNAGRNLEPGAAAFTPRKK